MVLVLCICSGDALYLFTKFHKNVSKGFSELFSGQGFQYLKFQRGIIPKKNVGEVMVPVLCLLSDDVLYLCNEFHIISKRVSELLRGHFFHFFHIQDFQRGIIL